MMKKYVLGSLALLLLLAGCREEPEIEILQRQKLFSLNLGKMEDQIDLFQIQGTPQQTKNRLFLKDDMFFLANGNSSKVIKLTSFGDLLFMLYNPDTNPSPLMLREIHDSEVLTNRFAAKFNLRDIGEIVVDSADMLYLEDKAPPEEKIWDAKLHVNLEYRVLKFNSRGQLVDNIGREGAGNSLFPYIESMHVGAANELIVICRVPGGWYVYWLSETGHLLYSLHLDEATLSAAEEKILTIDRIFPAYRSPRIYLQLTYYEEVRDDATEIQVGIENLYSRIFTVNMETGEFEKFIKIPDPGLRKYYTDSGEVVIPAPSFDFLGVTADEHYFLIRPEEQDRQQLLILDSLGREYADRIVILEDQDIFFRELKLAPDGLLYGLLCWSDGVDLVWWRSDKLLEAEPE